MTAVQRVIVDVQVGHSMAPTQGDSGCPGWAQHGTNSGQDHKPIRCSLLPMDLVNLETQDRAMDLVNLEMQDRGMHL